MFFESFFNFPNPLRGYSKKVLTISQYFFDSIFWMIFVWIIFVWMII